ncbi:MAG: putative toxin-antitoxin system toxin component, PIN family [Spirochaetales bacterium]|nr:putative toxin-antitoxin system toxin component, PIN family [Spirochaetales bacterium]
MKIVFDTNVILSAMLTQGLSYRVLDICIDLHEIVISPWIENEVYEKITDKFGISGEEFKKVKFFLNSNFNIIKPSGEKPLICRDKDDNNVLHTAKYCDASLIITGDKDLLSLKEYSGIKIVTPRQFMEKYYKT